MQSLERESPVRERVQSLTVAPERPRPGHLYACSLLQSGYAGRAHLFIAKMYLANREFEKADAAASGLIALNAAHETAVKLKAEIAQASAQAAKEKPAEAK